MTVEEIRYKPNELNADNAQLLAEAEVPDRDAIYWHKHENDPLPEDPKKLEEREKALAAYAEKRALLEDPLFEDEEKNVVTNEDVEAELSKNADEKAWLAKRKIEAEDNHALQEARDNIMKARKDKIDPSDKKPNTSETQIEEIDWAVEISTQFRSAQSLIAQEAVKRSLLKEDVKNSEITKEDAQLLVQQITKVMSVLNSNYHKEDFYERARTELERRPENGAVVKDIQIVEKAISETVHAIRARRHLG